MRLLVCSFVGLFISLSSALIGSIGDQETNYNGVARVQFTNPVFCDAQAFSILGDLGPREARINGTWGYQVTPCDRMKVTLEYLQQKKTFDFTGGKKSTHTGQGAVGATFDHYVGCGYIDTIFLNGTYSHAYGKKLNSKTIGTRTYERAIAGSHAYDINIGSTLRTFCGGHLDVYTGYQAVNYLKKGFPGKTANGWGGGAYLYQPVYSQLSLDLEADYRKAYGYYASSLNWNFCNGVGAGVFVSYTGGSRNLNNDLRYGVKIDFFPENNCCSATPVCCETMCTNSLCNWTSIPAVFRPTTLTIAVEKTVCNAPSVVGNPPALVLTGGGGLPFDTSVFFTGADITYSATTSTPGGSVTINPQTGQITAVGYPQVASVQATVTATNPCGSASFSLTLQPGS